MGVVSPAPTKETTPLLKSTLRSTIESTGSETIPAASTRPTSPWYSYLLPSVLYTISNNVTFWALELITPAHFTLLQNLKIPMTAILAYLFVAFRMNVPMVTSLVLLTMGSLFATFQRDSSYTSPPTSGILLMVLYSMCSAGGAVSTEYLTKKLYGSESMWMQNVKFCACGILCNALIVLFRLSSGGRLEDYYHLTPLHLVSVAGLVANGLVTGLTIKYAGSIVKTYAVAVAMFISAGLTVFVFDVRLQPSFYVGATMCVVAVCLYARARSLPIGPTTDTDGSE